MASVHVLEFHADGSSNQSGPLRAREEVVVRYHRARLAGQRELDPSGDHNWGLSGFCRVNGGAPPVFLLGGRSSDDIAEQVLTLGESGTLELWFERSGRYGQHVFDSDGGRNFRFVVLPEDPSAPTRALSSMHVPESAA